MATGNVSLHSESERRKVGQFLVRVGQENSVFAGTVGSMGSKDAATILVANEGERIKTFHVESVSHISANPTPEAEVLGDNLTGFSYITQEGTRSSFALGTKVSKHVAARTPRDPIMDGTENLGKRWARIFDQYFVSHAGLTLNAAIVTATTTATLGAAVNPSASANITAFELVANLLSIGHSDVASSKEFNVWFAGTDANGHFRSNPPVDSWTDLKQNPDQYKLTPDTFKNLKSYMTLRGVPPLNVKIDGRPVKNTYLCFIPEEGWASLTSHPEYKLWAQSGDLTSSEMWTGEPAHGQEINGIVVMKATHAAVELTGNTPLRVVDTNDTAFKGYEGIVLGAQAIGQAAFDDFEVVPGEVTDFGRKREIGADIFAGLIAVERNLDPTAGATKRRNTGSLLFAAEAFA